MAVIQTNIQGIISCLKEGATEHALRTNALFIFDSTPSVAENSFVTFERAYMQWVGFFKPAYGLPSYDTHNFYMSVKKGPNGGSWGGRFRHSGSGVVPLPSSSSWEEPGNWDDEAWGVSRLNASLLTYSEAARNWTYFTPVDDDYLNVGQPSYIGSLYTVQIDIVPFSVINITSTILSASKPGNQTLSASQASSTILSASKPGNQTLSAEAR